MKKVKLTIDAFAAEILKTFFNRINNVAQVIESFEVEHLVLMEWYRKNYLKTQFEVTYKITLMPHEAISLHRMLFRLGLSDTMAQITRDGICEQIKQQLPPTRNLQNLN